METMKLVNYIIAVVFTLCYSYQLIYVIIALIKKPEKAPDALPHRFAVMISARNEEAVIAQLIESIKKQKYPREMVDIYVVADNCTDSTAAVARAAGATVFERFNKQLVGKGYALDFLYGKIKTFYPRKNYDGFFVFDADNLLDENYIAEMNKTFAAGGRVITSYRNSKNYADNWISAGYSLWFLREAKYLNNPRMILGSSCAISGTGFLVHHEIMERNNGWKHFLLTEDIEFTVDSVLHGETIQYCNSAVIYDEQPTSFMQSWNQRMRWAKGALQVFYKYGFKLVKRMVTKFDFSSFDMTMATLPAILLTVFSATVNIAAAIFSVVQHDGSMWVLVGSVGETIFNAYVLILVLGAITVVTEWKQIHCKPYKKVLYTFTFPLFMFTYVPISVVAIFKKVEWKPIRHSVSKSIEDFQAQRNG